MKSKLFLVATIVFGLVFSLANFVLEAAETSIAMNPNFASHYTAGTHTLDLSKLGFTEDSLKSSLGDIMCFINSNKVVTLSLEANNFASLSVELLKQAACLLTGCLTLTTVSLKNNFKSSVDVEKGLAVSSVAMEQLASQVTQFQALFKDSLAAANQQTNTEYVSKSILLDDIPPLAIITEIKLPLTGCQKFRTFLVHFGPGFVSMAVSVGITVLTFYLTGHVGSTACPSNSTMF